MRFVPTLPRPPPLLQVSCDVYDVTPIPPDPVENVEVTFQQALIRNEKVVVTLQYSWSAPVFRGEGITGYQIWLEREPAPADPEGPLQEVGAGDMMADSDEEFGGLDTNFDIYLQVSQAALMYSTYIVLHDINACDVCVYI